MKQIPLRGLAVAGLLFGLVHAVQAESAGWPGFRGLGSAGVADDQKPPVHFGPTSNLLWKTEVPQGISSPVIWKDSIFATGAEGRKLITFCIDRRDGKKLWEQSVTVEKLEPVHRVNSAAAPTPVTDGRAVYVYFGSFGLLAYDFQGKELWRKPLPMPKTFFNQGTGTSPTLAEGKLLVFVQVGRDSHLLALDPKDGKELWRQPMPVFNNTYSTPVYWKEKDGGRAGLVFAFRFIAYRLEDGHKVWTVGDLAFQACSTPVVVGDRLIVSAAGGQGAPDNMNLPLHFDEAVKKYDRDGDGRISFQEIPADLLYTDRKNGNGEGNMSLRSGMVFFGGMKKEEKADRARWEEMREALHGFSVGEGNATVLISVRTGGSGDVTHSHVVWRETKAVPEVASPLVYRDRIYQIRSGGFLACRDLETGKLLYDKQTESRGGYYASPVAADGRIYLASDRGTVTVVKAGDNFEVLARNDLTDRIMASPAMAENALYVRSAKQLLAFGGKQP